MEEADEITFLFGNLLATKEVLLFAVVKDEIFV